MTSLPALSTVASSLEHENGTKAPTRQLSLPPPPGWPSRRGAPRVVRPEDDPFLAAYLECTKSPGSGDDGKSRTTGAREGQRRFTWAGLGLGAMSCKRDAGAVGHVAARRGGCTGAGHVAARRGGCAGAVDIPSMKTNKPRARDGDHSLATASHEAGSRPLCQLLELERGVRRLGVREQEISGGCAGAGHVAARRGGCGGAGAMDIPAMKTNKPRARDGDHGLATASHEAGSTPLCPLLELERGVRRLGVREQEISGDAQASTSRCSRRGSSQGSAAGVWASTSGLGRLEEESLAVVMETEDPLGGFRRSMAEMMVENRITGGAELAVVMQTEDPLGDFRRSMAELVVENRITGGAELRELLQRFLALNSPRHHHLILLAFADVGEELFGGGQPVFRPKIASKLKALRQSFTPGTSSSRS